MFCLLPALSLILLNIFFLLENLLLVGGLVWFSQVCKCMFGLITLNLELRLCAEKSCSCSCFVVSGGLGLLSVTTYQLWGLSMFVE